MAGFQVMSDGSIDNAPEAALAQPVPERSAIFFNGESSRRRSVTVTFAYALELRESLNSTVRWQYDDIRRADSPGGILRLSCLRAPALAGSLGPHERRISIRRFYAFDELRTHHGPERAAALVFGYDVAQSVLDALAINTVS